MRQSLILERYLRCFVHAHHFGKFQRKREKLVLILAKSTLGLSLPPS